MIPILILAFMLLIAKLSRNYNLKKIFNFRKELKQVKTNKQKPKFTMSANGGTLIGHAGRRPVCIDDNAKHVFVCGTTGSGKTVALSNFIKNIVDNDMPALIIDGKGDTGKGSILDIVEKMVGFKKKLYVVSLSDPETSDKWVGNIILSFNSRANEFRADSFAFELGYGNQLADALYIIQKMSLGQKMKVVKRMQSSHPRTSTRIGRLEALEDGEITENENGSIVS